MLGVSFTPLGQSRRFPQVRSLGGGGGAAEPILIFWKGIGLLLMPNSKSGTSSP
jgi:hypothetical protein